MLINCPSYVSKAAPQMSALLPLICQLNSGLFTDLSPYFVDMYKIWITFFVIHKAMKRFLAVAPQVSIARLLLEPLKCQLTGEIALN